MCYGAILSFYSAYSTPLYLCRKRGLEWCYFWKVEYWINFYILNNFFTLAAVFIFGVLKVFTLLKIIEDTKNTFILVISIDICH